MIVFLNTRHIIPYHYNESPSNSNTRHKPTNHYHPGIEANTIKYKTYSIDYWNENNYLFKGKTILCNSQSKH